MKTIKESIEIYRDAEFVFSITQDYSLRLEWDTYLAEAYLLNGKVEANEGVLSYCKNINGSVMISKYISFNPPKVAAVSMIEGPFILKKFSGAWNVQEISSSTSKLTFTYNFELKGSFLGKLLLPIASYLFSKDMKKRLLCFKAYAEQSYNKAV
jgi:ribosome-associated toxin RatA of RatAB toxin-antitoxin module